MRELPQPQRVLIFHIRVSMGHERAAQALAEAFRRRAAADVRLVEAIGYSSGGLAPLVCNSYLSIVKYAPPLWDFLYDHPLAPHAGEPLLRFWARRSRGKFLNLMSEFRPHLVICTQALPARILSKLKSWGDAGALGMDAPVFAVVTDFSIHRYWKAEEMDGYFLPGRDECDKLATMGVPPEKIFCSGIPIHPDMSEPVLEDEKHRARIQYGLLSDRPTVLLMGGSRGFGLKTNLMRELEHLPILLNVLALAGTNPSALSVMHAWAAESRHRVVPLEYSPDIRTLYALSDLAITKPGGLTLAECMAVGLPMVIQHALPGQERHNLEYLRKTGLGEIGSDPSDVVSKVQALLLDPSRRELLRMRLKSHARPNAALDIVDQLLSKYPFLKSIPDAGASLPPSACPSLSH